MSSVPELKSIQAFRLTTADPERLKRFYVEGLGFSTGASTRIQPAEMAQLKLRGEGRRLGLELGRQRLDLDWFDAQGRPYPAGASAADVSFQHFALVVTDIAQAYSRAVAHGATAISSAGPVKLPASAGGVTAVKFRDPEGHPLEFIQFGADPPPIWGRLQVQHGTLGIDHSAITVTDADDSLRFYQTLGLHLGRRTLNHGETQAALDGLAGPRVDVVPLEPSTNTPHLELLGYRTPKGRTEPARAANDVSATRIVWASDRDELLRDPDGHLHLLQRQA